MRGALAALVVWIAVLTGCGSVSPLERLAEIELERAVNAREIHEALGGSSAGHRALAARTCGRIQAAELAEALVPLLDDSDPAVRIEAAFALGHIARAHASVRAVVAGALARALETTPLLPAEAVATMVTALGVAGASSHGATLLAYTRDPRESVAGAALLALAEGGPLLSREDYVGLLRRSEPELRWKALHAAGRRAPSSLLPELARAGLADSSALVRESAVLMLLRADGVSAATLIADHLVSGERDSHVRIAALGVLERVRDAPLPVVLVGFLQAAGTGVQAAIARAMARDPLWFRDAGKGPPFVPADGLPALGAKVGAALERLESTDLRARFTALANDRAAETREVLVRSAARWVGVVGADSVRALVERSMLDPDPLVRVAALQSLVSLDPPAAGRAARSALSGPSLPLAVSAIGVLGTLARQGGDERARAALAAELLAHYRPSARPAVRLALLEAIASLETDPCRLVRFTGDPAPGLRARARELIARSPGAPCPGAPERSWRRSHRRGGRYENPDRLPARMEIRTPGGRVVIHLHVREAPRAIAHVSALVRDGAFAGASCHLARPDSVVAFGRPRGDGFGDDALEIAPEIGRRPVRRGTVALLVDRATGSCDTRIFLAMRPLPELDGRHTVFGTVVAGLDLLRHVRRGETVSVSLAR